MEACACLQYLRTQPAWLFALTAIGFLSLAKISLLSLWWTYISFLRPGKNLRKYGSWAVVTGATDGIGKAYAFQFARLGINLVLVGRNPEKLRQTAAAVKEKYGKTQVETVVIDLADDLDGGLVRLREKLEGLDVGILVNSAGLSYPYARYFHEVDQKLQRDLIKVNVEAVTKIIQAVLPGMLERKRGAIVNIGSGSAVVLPSDPLYAIYAATKAYVDQLSRCLYVEYQRSGIDVQCQAPLYVATKMASIRRSSFLVPSADTYAKAGLRWIGHDVRCTPYWPHSLLWGIVSILPESVVDKWRLNFCLNIRKKGLQKDAAKKEE